MRRMFPAALLTATMACGADQAFAPRTAATPAANSARTADAAVTPSPLLIVDGRLIGPARGEAGSAFMKGLEGRDIESVEVVRGRAAVAAHGPDAAGGVVFVRTRDPKR